MFGNHGIHASKISFMQPSPYFSTEEAAAYLGIKERKLYDLVARGAVPCSKVTGKWLFPRAALDAWVESGLVHPQGFPPPAPPPIIGGSHDPLLEWAARHSGSGLAVLAEGSEAGVTRLRANGIAVAAIHLHDSEAADGANARAMRMMPGSADIVVIGFARREQGLMVAPDNPLGLATLADALRAKARFGLRQQGAGAQALLSRLLQALDPGAYAMNGAPGIFATGAELALAIRAGAIDCGIGTRAVADAQGIGFVPLLWEAFDLALRRRTYFQPPMQALLDLMRGGEFARQAGLFGGYDIREAGQVRFCA
jgi:excisionase family DNA binding protein